MGEHWNASSLQMFCMPAECSLRKSRYLIQNAKVVLRKNKKTKNKEKKERDGSRQKINADCALPALA